MSEVFLEIEMVKVVGLVVVMAVAFIFSVILLAKVDVAVKNFFSG